MFERMVIGVGGFVLLLLFEAVLPFRRPVDSRWRRYLINLCIIGGNAFVLNVLLSGVIVAAHQFLELQRAGLLYRLGLDGWANALMTIVVLDGVTYAWHRAYHTVPVMWRMHRVHHSDLDLDVTSSGRFHLTEMALSAFFRLGVIALLGATLASVVLFEILFGILNQLEHANLRLPKRLDSALQWLVVTPDMHRIHHSQELAHTNSNYGTIFSFWDRWWSTYRCGVDQASLVLGLPEYPTRGDVSLGRVFVMPLGPSCEAARRRTATSLNKPTPIDGYV
jgi:sterol desaturase/sphingolipid hydroxylase (fatty acid hydroxylase superfamily)